MTPTACRSPPAPGARGSASPTRCTGRFRAIAEALALAGCSLADVIDTQLWLKDPRDFPELNRIYAGYFTDTRPVRSVFQNAFMMEFRIEMKVVAYRPLA